MYDGIVTSNFVKGSTKREAIDDFGDKYDLIDPSQYVIGFYIQDVDSRRNQTLKEVSSLEGSSIPAGSGSISARNFELKKVNRDIQQ